jgi:hypothetical protein
VAQRRYRARSRRPCMRMQITEPASSSRQRPCSVTQSMTPRACRTCAVGRLRCSSDSGWPAACERASVSPNGASPPSTPAAGLPSAAPGDPPSDSSPKERAMRRRAFILVALMLGASAPAPAQRPPTVVLVMMDDLGYGDLGSHGAPDVRTPDIDRLAREGVRLDPGGHRRAPSRELPSGWHRPPPDPSWQGTAPRTPPVLVLGPARSPATRRAGRTVEAAGRRGPTTAVRPERRSRRTDRPRGPPSRPRGHAQALPRRPGGGRRPARSGPIGGALGTGTHPRGDHG